MASLKDEVSEALRAYRAPNGTEELWDEVYVAYEEGGPDAVSELIERKVRTIRRSARAEASEMKAAAGAVKPRSKAKKRR